LGQQFAYMEAKLAVGTRIDAACCTPECHPTLTHFRTASIFSAYELALVPGQKVETEMAITLRFQYGLRCTLSPRSDKVTTITSEGRRDDDQADARARIKM
jgi:hypothetical protein